MSIITIDMETYYDKDFSLSKMTTEAYIRDPRFEVIGFSIKVESGPSIWFSGDHETLKKKLQQFNLEKSFVIAHNAAFDCAILTWIFGIKPRFIIDTLSMARPKHGLTVGGSLAALAKHYGLGEKGTEVVAAMGKRRADFSFEDLRKYGEYCCNDVDLTYELFLKLAKSFPRSELNVIDMMIRMFTEPVLQLDKAKLEAHLANVLDKKEKLMAKVETNMADLMSNDKFADVLRSVGVEPPMKISLRTGKPSYAFAKTDPELKDLLEHEDERVQALVAARLGVKSTLEETRTQSFIGIANRGPMPIPLSYYGAHTGRASGFDKINCMTTGHELLTPDGWVPVENYVPGTPIMQWWPDGGLSFDMNPGWLVKPYSGEVVDIDAPFVRGVFTPEHRMVGSYKGKVKERTAEWVAGHSGLDGMYVAGKFEAGESIFTATQVRFLVAVAADGSINQQGRLVFGFRKTRKIARIQQIAADAGVPLHIKHDDKTTHFSCSASELPKWVHKGFGNWVLRLGATEMDALLDELIHWDGFSNTRTNQPTFCTIHKDQALWAATVGHIRGRRASVYTYERETSTGAVHHVYFGNSTHTSIDTIRHVAKHQYEGTVYCPSVESSYILVRYKDAIHVTGQCQNLPRGGALRDAITAPDGYMLVACDSSQIEARTVGWLAQQDDLTQAFKDGEDIYSLFASDVYGRKVTKETDSAARHVGKTAILGLGYGMSAPKFKITLKNGKPSVDMPEDECKGVVDLYRNKYYKIPQLWRACQKLLVAMYEGRREELMDGLVYTDGTNIRLPNGLYLRYPELSTEDGKNFTYKQRRETIHVYGGKVTENIVQALARIIVFDQMAAISKKYKVVLTVHDEVVVCVPEAEVETAVKFMTEQMSIAPKWAAGLPITCEAGYGRTYGDCK